MTLLHKKKNINLLEINITEKIDLISLKVIDQDLIIESNSKIYSIHNFQQYGSKITIYMTKQSEHLTISCPIDNLEIEIVGRKKDIFLGNFGSKNIVLKINDCNVAGGNNCWFKTDKGFYHLNGFKTRKDGKWFNDNGKMLTEDEFEIKSIIE